MISFRGLFTRRPRGAPDPDAFFTELQRAHGLGPRYTTEDRYRDFRAVFMASRQGQRVLWEILGGCGVFRTGHVEGDAGAVYVREGERTIGRRIWAVLNAEPTERPERAEED